MFLADFHIHSTFSDGKHTIPEIVDLYGKQGIGCIAITDHLCEDQTPIGRAARYLEQTLTRATFPLYIQILKTETERAWDQYGMRVITGFEITKNSIVNSRSSHLLALNCTEFISADGDISEIAKKIRATGALVIAAHPVSTRKIEKQTYHLWDRRQELALAVDAWEVASGPYIFNEVLKSGLPLIASSDLHRKEQMTSWKTLLECEKQTEAILEAIRSQNLKFYFHQET
jgi:predicted metal-dependent phosphoesterase TrpH